MRFYVFIPSISCYKTYDIITLPKMDRIHKKLNYVPIAGLQGAKLNCGKLQFHVNSIHFR